MLLLNFKKISPTKKYLKINNKKIKFSLNKIQIKKITKKINLQYYFYQIKIFDNKILIKISLRKLKFLRIL